MASLQLVPPLVEDSAVQTKKCTKCGEDKQLSAYPNDRGNKDGKRSDCLDCNRARAREYGRKRDPAMRRAVQLRIKYGITLDTYVSMLERQGGRCAICGTTKAGGRGTFHVDHDHVAGDIRGLLCNKCNVGIGYFDDDIAKLASAIAYLDKARARAA